MLGTILLIVGLIALVLAVLSILGLDFGDFDVDIGDSGVGLLGVLSPFLVGFGVIGGGLLTFTDTPPLLSLVVGLGTGAVFAIASFAILGYLVGSEEELPNVDPVGLAVRIVEPVGPGHIGSGEVITPLGARILSITADERYAHNERVRIVAKHEDRDVYRVEKLAFDAFDSGTADS